MKAGQSSYFYRRAGLTPGNNASAGKKKSVRTMRASVYLKPTLVEIAHIAVKSSKTPYYKLKHERILKRRGKKCAIIAIARIILTAIFHMLSTGDIWNPSDLDQSDMSPELREKGSQKSLRLVITLFVDHGLITPDQIRFLKLSSAKNFLILHQGDSAPFWGEA